MSFKVIPTPTFAKSLKTLAKRHKSMKADMKAFVEGLEENPIQGVELSPGIRKIRMAIKSKGGGKSGGARVITYKPQFGISKTCFCLKIVSTKAKKEDYFSYICC